MRLTTHPYPYKYFVFTVEHYASPDVHQSGH